MLRVTLLSSEWRSTKGGVSTINRELAIQLAKLPNVEVSVYLPECSEDDKRVAASHRVKLIEAEKLHGLEPDLWLFSLPQHHAVDCVIGHGVDLGKQLQLIQRQHHCKWVQVVHSDPEELGMFKSHADAISKAQKQHQLEVKLCELSDQVVAVGPKLGDAVSGYLRPSGKDANVFILTPGIFSEFAGVKQASEDTTAFSVLVLGHGNSEDLQLKGYDIAAKAIAELKDESRPYKLKVVGVPSGQEKEVADMFLQQGIHRSQLVLRSFKEREQLAAQFCEVDLAVMPSRSEGFGLAALEALSAGLPLLVSGNSGLGEALKDVVHGSTYVLNSEDPKEWGRAIRNIREKRRELRLMEAKSICEEYAKKYSWEEQCRSLAKRMSDLAAGFPGGSIPASVVECGQAAFPTVSEDDLGSGAEGFSNGSVKIPIADPPVQEQSAAAAAAPEKVLSGQQPSSDEDKKGFRVNEEDEPSGVQSLQKESPGNGCVKIARKKPPLPQQSTVASSFKGLCGQQSFYGGVKKGSGGNEKGESDVQSLQGSRKQKTSGSTFNLGEAKKEKTNGDSTREKLAENEGTCTGENAERIKDALCPAELIDQIRQLYITREGWLAPFPWCEGEFFFHLDNIFTRLKMVSREKTRGVTTDKVVEMSAIFQPHEECQNPRSVLIEGKPGMGKTTYSNKVAYDWATKKPEEGNHFQNFQVVLLLRCRDIDSNLQDAIVDQILPVDVQERGRDKFLEFIEHNQPNVLLVLDGLDELPQDKLPEFSEIIQGRSRILHRCHLVVTARPETGIAVRKSFDTLLEIEGFTVDDAIDFISKFFKKKGENLALKLIRKVKRDKNLQELIANPLNTSLLCLLCEDLHGLLPENRTQLYVDIVQCVLRRYKKRKGLLVTCDDLMEEYKPQLLHLGWMALNGLHEDKTSFEEKQLANHASDLSEMGFLSVQPGSSKGRPCRHYAFLHKTFQELFAAYYLCCQLISQEISPDTLVADDRYFSELRQVLLFTCGMLAKPSPDATMALIKSSTDCINVKGGEREFLFVLKCINECKKEGSTFHVDLARAFGSLVTFTKLHLRCRKLGKTGAAAVADALRTNKTLTVLDLYDNNLGETGAAALADALRTNTTLTELNLSGNNLGETGAATLADALRTNATLTELDLSDNNLGETGAASLADALRTNTTLAKLGLSRNNLGETGAAALADALRTNTTLTKLYLYDNNLGETGAAALADALRNNTTLTLLNLSLNNLGETGAAALADALRTNTTLTELDLSDNNLGETAAAALADALRTNTTLTKLYLTNINLRETGAAALADALRTNTTLRVLFLSDNNLGETGAAAVADALRTNTTLTELYLTNNNLRETGAAALADALRTNTTLTVLCLSGKKLSEFVAKEIQKVHGDRIRFLPI